MRVPDTAKAMHFRAMVREGSRIIEALFVCADEFTEPEMDRIEELMTELALLGKKYDRRNGS